MIPYLDLKPQYIALEKDIHERIQTVLSHGQFILGPEVDECERALACYVGSRHCLTAASGTDALVMALMALGIGPGDEVITTPFSFFATAEVISLVGATPVFVDIDPETYNIDPQKVTEAVSSRTKAVLPVSIFGQPADFAELNMIAKKAGLMVIEDAAQSFGGTYQGQKSCHLSPLAATSFFPAKPLGCYGDGGAVFTDDSDLFRKMEQIRVHGQESRYHHVRLGINGRLDTLQCAILLAKLPRYDWELQRRQQIADQYNEAFAGLLVSDVVIPIVRRDRTSAWAQYTLLVRNREVFAQKLKARGVPTSVHYPLPLHHQPVYANMRDRYKLPVAEDVAKRCISLPLYPDMNDSDIEKVIEGVHLVAGV